MVEYSYPECTTAVLTAASLFSRHFPAYRAKEVTMLKRRALKYIKHAQRADGSWYGSWGICFTYATFFAVQSLEAMGETWHTSESVKKACDFLIGKQKSDGGWGEHWSSCEVWEYVQHEESQVVNTSWAVLALMHARYPDKRPIERGLEVRTAMIWYTLLICLL
jgi:lanosterol synthase